MSIVVSCQCGQRFQAPPHLAGKQVPCPSCKQPLVIPNGAAGQQAPQQQAPQQQAPQQAAGQQTVPVVCRCGGQFQAPANLVGRQVQCPKCGSPLMVGGQPAAAQPAGAGAPAQQMPSQQMPSQQMAGQQMGGGLPGFAPATGPSATGGIWDDEFPEAARNTVPPPTMQTSRLASAAMQRGLPKNPPRGVMPPDPKRAYTVLVIVFVLYLLNVLGGVGGGIALFFVEIENNTVFATVLLVSAFFSLVFAILAFLGMRGFKNRSPLGKIIAMIIGFLLLPSIPLGTLMGYFLLKGSMSEQAKAYFRAG